MITSQHLIILILAPFLTAFVVSILGWFSERWSYPLTLLGLGLSLFSSVSTLALVLEHGKLQYKMGGWPPPIGIEYIVDPLNALVLVVISTVALITAIYSYHVVKAETPDKIPQFYTLYLLLVTGLMGMTITGDAFNLYVLLEISSLTAYALVAMGSRRAAVSSFNYIIMGSIGASFYLLGVGYLYIKTGSLNMLDIQRLLVENHLYGSQSILVAFIFIMVGIWIKMAFFPLHGWLPNAYTHSPTSTSCLLAPLMTKVSVYIMIRIMFTVFSVDYIFKTLNWSEVVVWFSILAIVAGSIFALSQTELKKMLSYLIVAEVGYMVGGVWLANTMGLTGSIYHILSDALMTSCLFLSAGILVYKLKDSHLTSLKGIYRKMPVTMACFTVGAFSMIGIPPTCGFFSKWFLISGGIQASQWGYVVALLFSSLVNAIVFFRIIEIGYLEPLHSAEHPETQEHEEEKIEEAPLSMLLPLSAMAISLVLVGIYAGYITRFIHHFVATTGLII